MSSHRSPDTDTHVKLEFGKRMAIKVLAVFVVIGAFNFIRGIEAKKHDYEEAHSLPLVIVDHEFYKDCGGKPLPTPTSSTTSTPSSTPAPTPSPSPLLDLAKCRDVRMIDVTWITDKLRALPDVKTSQTEFLDARVGLIKYQHFQGATDIVQRLDAEIITAADYSKRAILTTLESEKKSVLNKQAELTQDEGPVTDKLLSIYKNEKSTQKYKDDPGNHDSGFVTWLDEKIRLSEKNFSLPTDDTIAQWRPKLSSTEVGRGRRTKSSGLTEHLLILWYRRIKAANPDTKKQEVFENQLKNADAKARSEIKFVYEKLKPELPNLIANALNSQRSEDGFLDRFNPTGIYDEKSGTYVVFQTLWMTCAMVLVFGVLFAVFLILRLLPGVADGMEVLKGHAGDLFSHAGMAIPQAGKSLLVGAATLGVGAAVAVGGSTAVSQLHLVESESIRGEDGRTGERGRAGETGKTGLQGKPGERGPEGKPSEPFTGPITIELQGPIPLPSPFILNGPNTVTLNDGSLQALKDYITQLSNPALSEKIKEQINTVAKEIVDNKINTLNIDSINYRLQKLENPTPDKRLGNIEENLKTFTATTFGDQLTAKLDPLKTEVAATRTAIEQLNIQPGAGPQGLFSRMKGAFKGDKYLMTYQSLTSLGLLIRTKADESCKTSVASSAPCCPSASAIATCPDDSIFKSLAGMIGQSPLDEKAFWDGLITSWNAVTNNAPHKKLDDWRVVILRQTRVAY